MVVRQRASGIGPSQVVVELRRVHESKALEHRVASPAGLLGSLEDQLQRSPLAAGPPVSGQLYRAAEQGARTIGRRRLASRGFEEGSAGDADEKNEGGGPPPHRETSMRTSSKARAIAAPASPATNSICTSCPMKLEMSTSASCHSEQLG